MFSLTDVNGKNIRYAETNLHIEMGSVSNHFLVWCGSCAGTKDDGLPAGTRLNVITAPIHFETLSAGDQTDEPWPCPNCGETGGTPSEYDFGRDSETGYHDAGVCCSLCEPKGRN